MSFALELITLPARFAGNQIPGRRVKISIIFPVLGHFLHNDSPGIEHDSLMMPL
jgi:hypothetical protein